MAGIFDSVNSLQSAMTYNRERQGVLSGNLANLDTPGYRPLDLAPMPTEGAGSLTVDAPGQMQVGEAGGMPQTFDDGGSLVGADGNAVSLERELAKIDANRVHYSTSADLVSRRMAMLKYAAGDGGQ